MIYCEEELQLGEEWTSYCKHNLGKRYQQWMVPVRILQIPPAEYVRLLVEEFNATIKYIPESKCLFHRWGNRSDETRWRLFINNKAKERGFHI